MFNEVSIISIIIGTIAFAYERFRMKLKEVKQKYGRD